MTFIDIGAGKYAVSDDFLRQAERFQNRMDRNLLFGNFDVWKQRQLLNADNRKWAKIIVGNTEKMAFVDNVTMKAYKADGYEPTWIEIKHFKFDRWARTMDL